MAKRIVVDAAVIGNSPAGSTIALKLSKAGLSVALLGLPSANKKLFGETLPPHIKTILLNLGMWDDFLNEGHLPSTGNMSSWGDAEIIENNFIFHPDAYGWHLNRLKYDKMLLNAAVKEGVLYLESVIETVDKYYGGNWNLKLGKNKKNKIDFINAIFLVDAIGRASWLSYRRGIKRLVFDNLCGYVYFLSPKVVGDSDTMTLIESAPDGWWYSALLPQSFRVVSFFTNSNSSIIPHIAEPRGWKKNMLKTNYIKLNIEKYNYEIISGPHIMMSNSSILEKVIGQNRLAAGDASVTFDPISSNGILNCYKKWHICSRYCNKIYK